MEDHNSEQQQQTLMYNPLEKRIISFVSRALENMTRRTRSSLCKHIP